MSKKNDKPRHLYAADYEWLQVDGREKPREWEAWSWAWKDDDASMVYVLKLSKGFYKLYFEGDQLGPKQGYTTMNRAAAAIAKSENAIRLYYWTEWRKREEKKRKKRSS